MAQFSVHTLAVICLASYGIVEGAVTNTDPKYARFSPQTNIPYCIDPSYPSAEAGNFQLAANIIQSSLPQVNGAPCVSFSRLPSCPTSGYRLKFTPLVGTTTIAQPYSFTYPGNYTGVAEQTVAIVRPGDTYSVPCSTDSRCIARFMASALGLKNEHQRGDRMITVVPDANLALPAAYTPNTNQSSGMYQTTGNYYDLCSITHNQPNDYGKSGSPAFTVNAGAKPSTMPAPVQRLSYRDCVSLSYMYQCYTGTNYASVTTACQPDVCSAANAATTGSGTASTVTYTCGTQTGSATPIAGCTYPNPAVNGVITGVPTSSTGTVTYTCTTSTGTLTSTTTPPSGCTYPNPAVNGVVTGVPASTSAVTYTCGTQTGSATQIAGCTYPNPAVNGVITGVPTSTSAVTYTCGTQTGSATQIAGCTYPNPAVNGVITGVPTTTTPAATYTCGTQTGSATPLAGCTYPNPAVNGVITGVAAPAGATYSCTTTTGTTTTTTTSTTPPTGCTYPNPAVNGVITGVPPASSATPVCPMSKFCPAAGTTKLDPAFLDDIGLMADGSIYMFKDACALKIDSSNKIQGIPVAIQTVMPVINGANITKVNTVWTPQWPPATPASPYAGITFAQTASNQYLCSGSPLVCLQQPLPSPAPAVTAKKFEYLDTAPPAGTPAAGYTFTLETPSASNFQSDSPLSAATPYSPAQCLATPGPPATAGACPAAAPGSYPIDGAWKWAYFSSPALTPPSFTVVGVSATAPSGLAWQRAKIITPITVGAPVKWYYDPAQGLDMLASMGCPPPA